MADGTVTFATELDASGIKSGLDGLQSTVNKWGAAVVGSKAFQAITEGIIKVAKAGVEYNAQMEAYQTNFAVLLGEEAAALEHVAELRDMAAKTPFGMEDLASASQTLLSFGVSADTVMDSISMLGDISLGNSEKFSSLSLAFAQVSAAGKLTGQDLLQMVQVGFNPLNTLAEATSTNLGDLKEVMGGGKGSKEFQKQMKAAQKEVKKLGEEASEGAKLLARIGEEGVISAEMVGIAMEMETSPGGRFYNGMEQASKTMSGMFSTLKDDAMQLAGNVFKPVSDALSDVVLPAAISAVGALNGLFEAADGKVELSADTQEAIDELEALDKSILAIMNKYSEESIKIKIEYEQSLDLIQQLEEIQTRLDETPRRLWSEQDVSDLQTLTSQLVELNPELSKFVGKDGIINKEADAIRDLVVEYNNLALARAASTAYEEAYSTVINAKTTRDVLVQENKILEERRKLAMDTAAAWDEMGNAAADSWDMMSFQMWTLGGTTQNEAVEKSIGLMQQYIDMMGGLDSEAFTAAGVDISTFFDGMSLLSAEEISASASAMDNLGAAMAVISETAFAQGEAQQTIISQLTADIDTSNAAVTAATQTIADAELRLTALEQHIAALESGNESIADTAATANEAIDSIQTNAEELTAEPYEAVVEVDDQATPAINEAAAVGEAFSKKTFTATLNLRTVGSFSSLRPSSSIPGHADGLSYVPYDDYIARLHKGEMVLTAKDAEALRRLTTHDFASEIVNRSYGAGAPGDAAGLAGERVVYQTINFNQPVQTPYEFAQMLKEYGTYGLAGE